MQKVLICLEYNTYADYVAKKGVLLAKKLNADISIIHLLNTSLLSKNGAAPQEVIETAKLERRNFFHELINKHNCSASVYIIEGNSGKMIIEKANKINAGIIVLGVYHRIKKKRVLMKSLAKEVVGHSALPVLIISKGKNIA